MKNLPVEPEPSRRFNLLFTVEGSGIQGMSLMDFGFVSSGFVSSANIATWLDVIVSGRSLT
jgi:hypothetical protein